jgi:transglutaminase-like putative cysteine protease
MLTIRHETIYRYSAPLAYTIQQLRLSPRQEPHQRTQSWEIKTPGQRHAFTDAFGNLSHMLTITEPHHEVRIIAQGIVNVQPLDRGRLVEKGELSPLVFTVPTRLTDATEAIAEFTARYLPDHEVHGKDFLSLAEAICGAVAYQSGATVVTSTAADALQLGQGVCQDHAHLFLSCCRIRNIPARYVSGYIDPGNTSHAESHAWVDVWTDDSDFCGWTSVDVTHAKFASDSHCRLAIGRDYDSAAPVRGVRHGGGEESLSVAVSVTPD